MLHFFILGLMIFCFYSLAGGGQQAERGDAGTIIVSREAILRYMQHREKFFDVKHFGGLLDSATVQQRERLIKDYVAEEALYREAKALGLDQNDYLAKRRLIMRLENILLGLVEVASDISDEDIRAYYQANTAAYHDPAKVTFTHVFVSHGRGSDEDPEALARSLLANLNHKSVDFHEALAYGDRFLYHRHYVNKEADLVASHFGEAMQNAVFSLPADDRQWQGPYTSPYGYHLVLVTRKTAGIDPPFNRIAGRVRQDALREQQARALKQTKTEIVERYQVVIEDHLDQVTMPAAELKGSGVSQ